MFPQPWIFITITIATLLHMCSLVKSFPEADKIKSLPGQPPVISFQQFAGYIAVDDDKQQRALFYYFVEAEINPASKSLVLWLNGGPGCTSIGLGAFTEHGPFVTNQGEAIVKNQYSWNKEANILYLESPAGVGFSYSVNRTFYSTLNDEVTAQDSLVFLQRWFAKFPEYNNRDFYIMGESYAGHYVPQLAELIVNSKVNFNLRGIAIGNPLLDLDTNRNAADEYYWSHGIISDYAYKIRTSLCNSSRLIREIISGHQISPDCINAFKKVSEEYSFLNSINAYYVIGNKCLSYSISQANFLSELLNSGMSQFLKSNNVQQTDELDQQLDECNEKYAEMYLNRKDVQKALHAKLVGTTSYHLCSKYVQRNYDQSDKEIPTINVVGFLWGSRCCVSIHWHAKISRWTRLKTEARNKCALLVDKQVGGWTQVYGDHLTYATIRGASHGAPTTQPKRSFVLFNVFLHGKRLPKT